MAMSNRGMNKLMEECGELIAVLAKKSAYPDTPHPSLAIKNIDSSIEDEIGDVLGAISFVMDKLRLSEHDVHSRAAAKYNQFLQWDKE
jgi:NTP pyrophosphatase (non-canonical NTP hydrolase)